MARRTNGLPLKPALERKIQSDIAKGKVTPKVEWKTEIGWGMDKFTYNEMKGTWTVAQGTITHGKAALVVEDVSRKYDARVVAERDAYGMSTKFIRYDGEFRVASFLMTDELITEMDESILTNVVAEKLGLRNVTNGSLPKQLIKTPVDEFVDKWLGDNDGN